MQYKVFIGRKTEVTQVWPPFVTCIIQISTFSGAAGPRELLMGLFLWVKNRIDSSVLRFVFTEMETNYSLNEKSLLTL